jgi:hypothetical protein
MQYRRAIDPSKVSLVLDGTFSFQSHVGHALARLERG